MIHRSVSPVPRPLARAALLALAATVALTGAVAGGDRDVKQKVPVEYHMQATAQSGGVLAGVIPGAVAILERDDDEIKWKLRAELLRPGHAYTVWVVVINNKSACAAHPCTGPEIVQFNDATQSQVFFGDGKVGPRDRDATFRGRIPEGMIPGWFANRGLNDSMAAQIHLVLNDHGPVIASHMPGMIETYRGGCTDASLPPLFHNFAPASIADGTAGPNACQLFQAATFDTP